MMATTWKDWLNNHKSRARYDRNPERVRKLCDAPGSAAQKFERLAQNKNIVLLSKVPIGKKCQATFLHSVVGCPIAPEELRYVARSGMRTGHGVELDPDTMFGTSTAKLVPSVKEMMKVTSAAEVEGLKAPRTDNRKKVNGFALLTPALAEACQHVKMVPAALLVAVV